MSKKQSLEKQLAIVEKQSADAQKVAQQLREQIEVEKNKNKPKNIMDIVKGYEDACKYKKVKPTLSYKKRDSRSIASIAHDRLEFTISVLNEGHKFKMDKVEKRYYIWWELDPSSPSGLRFVASIYNFDCVVAGSSAHLCFKSAELAKHTHDSPEILKDWSKFQFGK